jgi:hypothetical protein
MLVVMVKKFSLRDNDAFVTVADPTGEMDGTIHSKVLESDPINLGAVLILEKPSIFTPTPLAHYLNITKNNVFKVIPASSTYPPSYEQVDTF